MSFINHYSYLKLITRYYTVAGLSVSGVGLQWVWDLELTVSGGGSDDPVFVVFFGHLKRT